MRTKRLLAAALLAVVALVAQSAAAAAQDGTPTGAPGEVVDLEVSATSDSVTVSWGAPETGGAPTRYRVNLKPADGGRGKVKNPKAHKTSVTYRNLKADETYKVWVRALNDHGKGPKVHYSENIALVPSSQAPAEVQGGSGDQSSAPQLQQQGALDQSIWLSAIHQMYRVHKGFQVYWLPPQRDGDSVTGYDLEYREYDSGTSTWGNWTNTGHTGTETFFLLTGLEAETRYQTRVRSWMGNRYSRWSSRSGGASQRTVDYQTGGFPDPPTVPTATAGPGKVTVFWADPGTANNSVEITEYQVGWRTGSVTAYSPKLPTTRNGYEIVGLAANTTYEVWVRAHAAPRGGQTRSTDSPIAQVTTLNPLTLDCSSVPQLTSSIITSSRDGDPPVYSFYTHHVVGTKWIRPWAHLMDLYPEGHERRDFFYNYYAYERVVKEARPYTNFFEYTIGQSEPFSVTLPEARGGHGPRTYRFDVLHGVNLRHSGFAFDPATRVLSSITGDGVSSFPRLQYVAYTVTDSTGETGRVRCHAMMKVHPAVTLAEVPDQRLVKGEPASVSLTAASGGTGDFSYEMSGAVAGLTVSGSTLSGTPTEAGDTTLTWTATDANGAAASTTFSVHVAAEAPEPLTAPASVAAEQTHDTTVELTWTAVQNAESYIVQIKVASAAWPTAAADAVPNDAARINRRPWTGAAVYGISVGDYRVRIAARNIDGVGPWSPETTFSIAG